jgi:glycosyltransferase involved in cell wall biosynthesis
MKVTLIVPVLNEISGMKQIMPKVKKECLHEIIIIDGGSTDGTVEYARGCGYRVYKQKRPGIRLGYIENHTNITGDIIITFSPDGNSVPELIPELIDKMKEGYDMVIASRYLKGAKSYDDTPLTRAGNFVFTKLINILFGAHYTDAMVMYRAYKKNVPHDLGLTKIRSERYERVVGRHISWEPQLSARCAAYKLKVAEIPGDEPARIADAVGKSGLFLPASRIRHFRAGIACLYALLEDFIKVMMKRAAVRF